MIWMKTVTRPSRLMTMRVGVLCLRLKMDIQEQDKKKAKNKQSRARNGKDKVKPKPKSVKGAGGAYNELGAEKAYPTLKLSLVSNLISLFSVMVHGANVNAKSNHGCAALFLLWWSLMTELGCMYINNSVAFFVMLVLYVGFIRDLGAVELQNWAAYLYSKSESINISNGDLNTSGQLVIKCGSMRSHFFLGKGLPRWIPCGEKELDMLIEMKSSERHIMRTEDNAANETAIRSTTEINFSGKDRDVTLAKCLSSAQAGGGTGAPRTMNLDILINMFGGLGTRGFAAPNNSNDRTMCAWQLAVGGRRIVRRTESWTPAPNSFFHRRYPTRSAEVDICSKTASRWSYSCLLPHPESCLLPHPESVQNTNSDVIVTSEIVFIETSEIVDDSNYVPW
ncbi:hypothetical protein Tco_0343571 [Tanacetum coccineum]